MLVPSPLLAEVMHLIHHQRSWHHCLKCGWLWKRRDRVKRTGERLTCFPLKCPNCFAEGWNEAGYRPMGRRATHYKGRHSQERVLRRLAKFLEAGVVHGGVGTAAQKKAWWELALGLRKRSAEMKAVRVAAAKAARARQVGDLGEVVG